MNANAARLVSCRLHGWRTGFANMLAKENVAWWRTRRWWIQSLVAIFFVDGSVVVNHQLAGQSIERISSLGILLVIAGALPIAAIILGQDSILGEIHSGTAAWMLSKPLRRSSFLLAKTFAYGLGFLVTGVILPGGIAFLQIIASGGSRSFLPGFAGSLGLVYLNLLFYLTLTLMLSTLFHGRGPVVGITLFILFLWIIPPSTWLAEFMPWRLVIATGNNALPALSGFLLSGQPLPTVAPIIATALWCVLFVFIAIWRFRREEF